EDAGQWVELEWDTENNTITASLEHLATVAIIGAVTPPPPPAAPAAFSVSNLTVKPAEVQLNEAVTITVSVANTGGTEGSYSVVLKMDGVKEAEKSVTIAAGSSEMVTFSVTREDAGSYSVAVDGLSGSFTVAAPTPTPPPPPTPTPTPTPETAINWLLVGGIIAAVVIVGLSIFFWLRKRAA
ncbi:MAG TPA: CARDB domain-containing protein, partial [Dehalococcoidales bacterium]|nr:CARDB domain-containing protein [Dehalococcoidales bacterium]